VAPVSGRLNFSDGTRAPLTIPQGPNQRWSLDFLSDAFADGRRFRILAIVDDCSTNRFDQPTPPTEPPLVTWRFSHSSGESGRSEMA